MSDKLGLERFESVQPEYNFGTRDIERELLPLCEDQQVGVIPYQALMGGILSGTYDRNATPPDDSHMASRHAGRAMSTYWNDVNFDRVEQLKSFSREMGCEAVQLVLAWVLSRQSVTSVIVGASRPEQVVKNGAAVDLELPREVADALERL